MKATVEVCRVLQPTCDPRGSAGANYCGRQPADINDSGVLALWGEGTAVTQARGVQLLGDDGKWAPLKPKTTLRAGNLLYVPLKAQLQLNLGKVQFGATPLAVDRVNDIRGHVIAVTGASAARLLTMPTRKGAISPAQLKQDVESGRLETGAPTKKDYSRIIKYGQKPIAAPTPTREEIDAINKNFGGLHFKPGRGVTPDGRDIEPGTDKPKSGK